MRPNQVLQPITDGVASLLGMGEYALIALSVALFSVFHPILHRKPSR
ncbi:MAG: hypothetical protein ABSD75_02540 [Terriglobales bacterium]|jgi:hypothetical protein